MTSVYRKVTGKLHPDHGKKRLKFEIKRAIVAQIVEIQPLEFDAKPTSKKQGGSRGSKVKSYVSPKTVLSMLIPGKRNYISHISASGEMVASLAIQGCNYGLKKPNAVLNVLLYLILGYKEILK